MKITIEVDCTPEEARAFMGMPDVRPMQDEIMADMAVSHAIRTPGATSQAHHRPLQL